MHATAHGQNRPTAFPPGIFAVTLCAELRVRTRELALLAGRMPLEVSQADYEQAKRKLLGTGAAAAQSVVLKTPDTH